MLTNHNSVYVFFFFLVQSGNAGCCSLRAAFSPKAPKMMTQNLLSDNQVLKRTTPSGKATTRMYSTS
ncbi:uncharacterized protein P174DRAFT_56635 [Aspergillus novofumigatus IBT 16806]|uniref:Secreted protein n=1 Tax=Aspergillus novofumigatus (strain IBT 16806) TaxID=1392255 RepID=A0A2I1BVF1_ASPN1|nr:uncharacterized protein P174DRAFT_56635 [Aspergillus novofumigatus IBT 16806]PKX89335.1 hypothetical protein P174DRAFT_56635 [Aspergillus novofumigatus IBT 16806]